MIDIRYLAVTVIAIFMALAIGLMTGSALGSPDRRDAAYEALRSQFELLREQNQSVQEESDQVRRRLDARDDGLRELLPRTLAGRLSGSHVAVLVCGGLDERPFWGEIERALQMAGAEIGPVVRVPDRIRELDEKARRRAQEALAYPASADDELEPLAWLMRALAVGDAARATWLAQQLDIELRGSTAHPIRRVLILVAAEDADREAAVASDSVPETRLIAAALAEGMRVVAAEREDAEFSAVSYLRRHVKVTSVDNIDTPLGALSAVLALSGAEGHFGTKPGAARPIPPLQSP